MDNERDRTVAVLRAMDRAAEELRKAIASRFGVSLSPAESNARRLLIKLRDDSESILDAWNNSGLPEDEAPPIKDEEWKS